MSSGKGTILQLINKEFRLNEDLMNYPQFRTLWERDQTEDKAEAYAYIGLIFMFNNPTSSYYAYSETKRIDEIIARTFPDHMKSIKPELANDAIFQAANQIYLEDLQLSPYRMTIDSAKEVLESLSARNRNAETSTDEKLKNIPKIIEGMKMLKEAEKLCEEDEINSRVKGNRKIKKREQ